MSNDSELPNEQAPRRLRCNTYDWLMSWKLSVDVAPPPPHHLPEAMSHISFNNSLLHALPDRRRGRLLNPGAEEDIAPPLMSARTP